MVDGPAALACMLGAERAFAPSGTKVFAADMWVTRKARSAG
jgi:hypothetical protein